MTNVCVVGTGLIGGSLGLALRRRKNFHVMAWARTNEKLCLAQKRRAAHSYSSDLSQAVSQADIVVLAMPVQHIVSVGKKIIPSMKKGSVLTDVGSTKQSVAQELQAALKKRPGIHFVGGHPVAGSEKRGIQFAEPTLFKNATCVLIPGSAAQSATQKVKAMWRAAGASCILMSAQKHDRLLALTSHLPHVISFAFFQLAMKESRSNRLVRSLQGGSFRDMTRIAASDPTVWAGILSSNKSELKKLTRAFVPLMNQILKLNASNLKTRLGVISREKQKWLKN